MSFTVQYKMKDDGICILTPEGRLNAVSATGFKKEATAFFDKNKANKIILDMSKIDFIDSSGLSLLITFLRKAREQDGGFFRISAVRPQVLKIIKLTLLDRVFEIYETPEQALKKTK
ncbi:MAG: STAS domain-containing protein [Treponema sp.]|jgi:anti-sigma B factor antagonist|nr:STAS domain-containing protein [Treponema sp.]